MNFDTIHLIQCHVLNIPLLETDIISCQYLGNSWPNMSILAQKAYIVIKYYVLSRIALLLD